MSVKIICDECGRELMIGDYVCCHDCTAKVVKPDSSMLEKGVGCIPPGTELDHSRCFYCGGEFRDGDLVMEIEDGHMCHVDCRGNA